MIDSPNGETIGHVGLYRFDYENRACEIDNIVRGESIIPGIMTFAVNTLIDWSKRVLKLRTLYLTVYQDNERAIKLYRRVGFVDSYTIPLKKIVENNSTRWEETDNMKDAERYFLKMKLAKWKKSKICL
jgi:RimJ/RimL family protein N-acetyltransferase